MMRHDFKKSNIRRTRHFKKKNPWTIRRVMPFIKLGARLIAFAGLILLAVIAAKKVYGKLGNVEHFHIKKMVFKGCEKSKEADLIRISGVDEQTSMIELDLEKLKRDIISHPWIKQASIKKQLPDKLYICVEERTPVALVNVDNLYYVDESATVFKKVESGDDKDFPVITGLSEGDAFGKRPEGKKLLIEAINLIFMLKERAVFSDADISEINLDKQKGITLFSYKNAMPIKIGFQFNHDRFDKLVRVLKALKNRSLMAEYIDIDYDNRVVVKVAAEI